MGFLFGGGDTYVQSPPPAPIIQQMPPLPPPPPPDTWMDAINEVTGTETVRVTGADGKKQVITRRLPRSPEEQRIYDQAGDILNTSFANIQQLYQYNPNDVVDFQPIVDTISRLNQEQIGDWSQTFNLPNFDREVQEFKRIQSNLMQETFKEQNRSSEEELARRGLSESTLGSSQRAAMARQQALAKQQSDLLSRAYGEELTQRQLERNIVGYQGRQQGREAQRQATIDEYLYRQQHLQDLEKKRQQAIAENQNLMQIAAGVRGQDLSKALSDKLPDLSTNIWATQNADALGRYNAGVNAQMGQYKTEIDRALGQHNMALGNYNAEMNTRANAPPSFGQSLLHGAGMIGGTALLGPLGGLGGSALMGSGFGRGSSGLTNRGMVPGRIYYNT